MAKKESAAEVLGAAIKTEQEGQAFYLKAAAQSQNKLARGMFESLAADEKRHEEWLNENIAGKVVPAKSLEAETNRKLRTVFSSMSESERDSLAATKSDTDALKKALVIEQKSVDYYEKWAKQSSLDEVKRICALIAREERNHVKIVGNMREYLDETGNWFMGQEGWIFDGGGSFA